MTFFSSHNSCYRAGSVSICSSRQKKKKCKKMHFRFRFVKYYIYKNPPHASVKKKGLSQNSLVSITHVSGLLNVSHVSSTFNGNPGRGSLTSLSFSLVNHSSCCRETWKCLKTPKLYLLTLLQSTYAGDSFHKRSINTTKIIIISTILSEIVALLDLILPRVCHTVPVNDL